MSANYLQCLNQLASYFKVTPGKLYLEDNLIPVCSQGDKITKGFSNILNDFLIKSKSKLYNGSPEDKAEIRQWIEFAILYGAQCNSTQSIQQVLAELNEVLSVKTFLVGYNMSIADVMIYYTICNGMQNLTYLDKGKYLHVSRWFDNVQQDSSLRQKNKIVDFKTNYLFSSAPPRH